LHSGADSEPRLKGAVVDVFQQALRDLTQQFRNSKAPGGNAVTVASSSSCAALFKADRSKNLPSVWLREQRLYFGITYR
jgi:6-phosphogluconate dehydrogenase